MGIQVITTSLFDLKSKNINMGSIGALVAVPNRLGIVYPAFPDNYTQNARYLLLPLIIIISNDIETWYNIFPI